MATKVHFSHGSRRFAACSGATATPSVFPLDLVFFHFI